MKEKRKREADDALQKANTALTHAQNKQKADLKALGVVD
jgi:hypothetical protein